MYENNIRYSRINVTELEFPDTNKKPFATIHLTYLIFQS